MNVFEDTNVSGVNSPTVFRKPFLLHRYNGFLNTEVGLYTRNVYFFKGNHDTVL